MKFKISAFLLIAALLLSFAGCRCSCGKEEPLTEEIITETDFPEVTPSIELNDPAKAIVQLCDDYEAFSGDDFDAVVKRYNELMYEAEMLGYTPVIVFPDDELVRNIYSNLDMLDYQKDKFIDAPESLINFGIKDIRIRALDANSSLLLTQLKADRNGNFDIIGFEKRSASADNITDALTRPDTDCDVILILKFHSATPWDILCTLPIGGWNECPSAYVFASVAKRWNEECGIVPALISSRTLEWRITGDVSADNAETLAAEMYCIAPQSDMFACRSASGVGKFLQNAEYLRFDWIRTK